MEGLDVTTQVQNKILGWGSRVYMNELFNSLAQNIQTWLGQKKLIW